MNDAAISETRPELVALAKSLARKKPKGGQMSLRAISAELAKQGFLNERGMPRRPLTRSIGKTPLAVINHAPPQIAASEPSIVTEARQALQDMGAEVAAAVISQRVALSHAIIRRPDGCRI